MYSARAGRGIASTCGPVRGCAYIEWLLAIGAVTSELVMHSCLFLPQLSNRLRLCRNHCRHTIMQPMQMSSQGDSKSRNRQRLNALGPDLPPYQYNDLLWSELDDFLNLHIFVLEAGSNSDKLCGHLEPSGATRRLDIGLSHIHGVLVYRTTKLSWT